MELTKKQRKLIIDVLDDLKEYFSVMEKGDEFKAHFLKDDSWVDFFKQYEKGGDNFGFEFTFCVHYDMWINNSNIWPVIYNPE
jgi:hypothetical protein